MAAQAAPPQSKGNEMDEKKENEVVAMDGEGKVVMVEIADP